MKTKICSICTTKKPITNFHSNGWKGIGANRHQQRHSQCQECRGKKLTANDRCKTCRKSKHGLGFCQWCRDRDRLRHKRAKETVLEAYGKTCAFCNCNIQMFLTIDHINDDGAKHRRDICGVNNSGTAKTYRWLIKNKFPEGFQTLCFNCNCAKANYGEHAVRKAINDNLHKS